MLHRLPYDIEKIILIKCCYKFLLWRKRLTLGLPLAESDENKSAQRT